MTINSEVRAFAERLAKLEADKQEIVSDIADVRLEAKGKGYDALLLGKVARLLMADSEKRKRALDQIDLFGEYIDQAGLR